MGQGPAHEYRTKPEADLAGLAAYEAGFVGGPRGEVESASKDKWRHVKRGSTYSVVGSGRLQCANPIPEGVSVVVYRGEDGRLWVRPESEFYDGRFVREG